ncbi:MAG: citrate (Si)-synthase, partial [Deltaproteobacteria bacterium]|nr:citrate (Si)-synthase [Deltaproteobacteria bacterium]
MAEAVNVKNIGLRGVTVADTKVSFIDGDQGILIYRGYRIEQLAEEAFFMEVAYMLLHEDLPNKEQLAEFEAKILEA